MSAIFMDRTMIASQARDSGTMLGEGCWLAAELQPES